MDIDVIKPDDAFYYEYVSQVRSPKYVKVEVDAVQIQFEVELIEASNFNYEAKTYREGSKRDQVQAYFTLRVKYEDQEIQYPIALREGEYLFGVCGTASFYSGEAWSPPDLAPLAYQIAKGKSLEEAFLFLKESTLRSIIRDESGYSYVDEINLRGKGENA